MESRIQRFEGKNADTNIKHHHTGFNIISIVMLTIFLVTLVLNITFLNASFMTKELKKSTVSTQITSNVNQELSQYGLPANVMTKKLTNRLILQATKQVYAGKQIDLNLSPVFSRAEKLVDANLAGLGVSTSQLPTTITATVKEKINTSVVQQINTTRVQTFTKELIAVKRIERVLLFGSGIFLVLLFFWALIKHHFWGSLGWTMSFAGLLAWVVLKLMATVASSLLTDVSELSAMSDQVVADFNRVGNLATLISLVIGVLVIVVDKILSSRRL